MFQGRDILSMRDFTKEEILFLLDHAKKIKKSPASYSCKGSLMASCFFEPSTRTRLSFEAAMKRLGGDVIGFADGAVTSAKKGESLSDSMRVIGSYVDVIVIRHPMEGSAKEAAEATKTPVINGGDGANEHPTQTFLDLFTIEECQGTLEGLKIAFVGDLKYARTVHSLALALRYFKPRLYFVAPPSQVMPEKICQELKESHIPFSFHNEIEEVIGEVDILYMTRIQKERFSDHAEYERLANRFVLTRQLLEGKIKPQLKVLSPLPRLGEIATEVDETSQAWYFQQAENGLYVRQALLNLILEK